MIEFEDVRIAYKDKPVLDGVSLTIHDREFFVLIGSSGCGKTTLLKSINKLLPLRGGSLSIFNNLWLGKFIPYWHHNVEWFFLLNRHMCGSFQAAGWTAQFTSISSSMFSLV